MIYTTNTLLDKLKDYSNPNDRITRLLKQKKIYRIIRGVYCDEPDVPNLYIANAIYNPSYISFETALRYYDLIPESVFGVTCATTNLTKNKEYKTHLGLFGFYNIPKEAFPLDIKRIECNGYTMFIASAEKALCDKLYECPVCVNLEHFEYLLFEDLRIDDDEFEKLDKKKLIKLAPFYHSKNLNLLIKFLKEKYVVHN